MKRLLIASVSVLALSAGAAFADSMTDITQEGSNNSASVDQANGGGTNNAWATQSGGGNATILQVDGTAIQTASITQTGNDGTYTNTVSDTLNNLTVASGAVIYQNGSTSWSPTSGSTATNTAIVSQNSNSDGALVIQGGVGGSNNAYVTQGGTGYATYDTASIVQDTGLAGAPTNTTWVNQNITTSGSNNLAMVHQH